VFLDTVISVAGKQLHTQMN